MLISEKQFPYNVLTEEICYLLQNLKPNFMNDIQEIRLRVNKPILIKKKSGNWFLTQDGIPVLKIVDNLFKVDQTHIMKTFSIMSENSIYAFLDDIKNGFITLKGGNRVGIAGKVITDGEIIKNIKEISGLNLRFSKQVTGCSKNIMKYIVKNNNEILNTLIISPPQCGKTTLIRDMAKTISDGDHTLSLNSLKVSIIDERSEIAACYKGIPQNDVGFNTDVLDSCPKNIGMRMALRSLSPDVIITDEIGGDGDRDSIINVVNAGVKIITTVHGYDLTELRMRKEILNIMNEGVFERYVVLSNFQGPGTIEQVIEGKDMNILFKRKGESNDN